MCFVARRVRKKKIKTQNDKIVETDMDIWCYTDIKKVIIREKQCNVSSRKNNL